jgi:hypothetical protein
MIRYLLFKNLFLRKDSVRGTMSFGFMNHDERNSEFDRGFEREKVLRFAGFS